MVALVSTLAVALAPSLLKLGQKALAETREFKHVQEYAAELLISELRYDNEVLEEMGRRRNAKTSQRVASLSSLIKTEAFDSLVASGVPLSLIFGAAVPLDVWKKVEIKRKHAKARATQLWRAWEVLECTYLHLSVIKLGDQIGQRCVDCRYVNKLVRASVIALRRISHELL